MRTAFPRRMAPAAMIRAAHVHAADYGLAIDSDRDVSDDNRAVVNWLRHEHTDYDDDQAAAFPWLADECARQIRRRAEAEAQQREFTEEYERERRRRKEERRLLVERSRQAIHDKRVQAGQRVPLRAHGRTYQATVTSVARSRATVSYALKSGAVRTATVYAVLLLAESPDTLST